MDENRRQFERLQLPAEAIAVNEAGQRLGLVAQAGGGGMSISLDSDVSPEQFPAGTRLRITIVEPAQDIRHTLDVEVRYVARNVVGLEFVTGRPAAF
ncbi:MAG TPA: PilZ domain-containing protein [Terriglobales bacterium]|nr:PilZ domain-containing protein [Terriglobales bacterium]